MDIDRFRDLINTTEKNLRIENLTKAWTSLEYREQAFKESYPQFIELFKTGQLFFKKMILEESDYNKVLERLDTLYKTNKIIKNRIEQEKLDKKLKEFREHRNNYLAKTDWVMLPDVELDKKDKELYRRYRKYLRKLPELYKLKVVDKLEVLSLEDWKKSYLFELDINKI